MATIQALIWEDPILITSSGDPVGTAHYYTEDAQSLFFTGSDLKTALIKAPEGQWGTPDAPITVDDTITYVNGRLDHPSFGIMYGAMSGGSLHLLVYIYAADISEWNMSATQIIQANSAIHGMKMLVADTDRELFENDNSLFSPTNVITTDVTWGDNEIWLPLYRWFIDSIPFDELRNAHAVQCRTTLGMWFSDVSFDEDNEYTGQRDTVFKDIITDSVTVLDPSYIIVQTDATAIELEFRPSEKRLTGLLRELNTIGWNIIQMPDWRIIVGDNAFIRSFQPNSRYSFSKANDVFTRKITRNADSSYTRIRAYAGDFIRIQYATIPTFAGWNLPVKTWDIRGGQGSDPDEGMTDAELLSLAQETALKMQFIGVTETITGSMRPELLPSDVGQIYDPELDAFIALGILTQVRHEFGNTFQTKFDLDSGGDFTDVGDEVESNNIIIKGANRTLRTSDFIQNSVNDALVKVSSNPAIGLKLDRRGTSINNNEMLGDLDMDDKALLNVDAVIMNLTPTDTSHVPSKQTWNSTLGTQNIDSSFAPVSLQVGHEQHALVYNNTGSILLNGKVVRKTGVFQDFATVELAISDEVIGVEDELGMTTMDIPIDDFGIITTFGKVNDVNTSTLGLGNRVFISADIAGNVTDVKPVFPNYGISLGFVAKVGVSDGQIILQIAGRPRDTKDNVFNGSFRETVKLMVSSDGLETTASLSPGNGQPNLTMQFRSGDLSLITTPAITKVLTDGTEPSPQNNYIYKLESDKANTDFQVSTSGFPNAEHIKIAFVVLKSVTDTQSEGAYVNQNWNDHIQDDDINMGHLLHITERMRQDLPKHDSGAEGTLTIVGAPTPDDVFFTVTSGFVYQIHKQAFPALDMQTGDDLHVLNDFTAPNKTITNINGETLDALGNSLTNRAFSFVFGGVINRTGQTSHIWMNKPIGSYQKNATATATLDPTGLSVYDIPDFFKSTGFLIGRATLTLSSSGNVWTLVSYEDLRGQQPNTTAGGGGGGGTGVTSFTGLTDTPNSYLSQANKTVVVNDVGGGNGDQVIFDSYLHNQRSSVTIDLTAGDYTLTLEELTTNLIIISAVTLGNAIIAPAAVADQRIEYTIDNRDLTNPVTVKINGGRGIDIPADSTAKVYYNDKVGIADYDFINNGRANFSAWNNYTYGELSTFTENELEFVRII